MARGPRQQIIERWDASMNHIEKVKEYIMLNGEMYRVDHPEIAQQCEVAYALAEELRNLLEGFRQTY